MSETRRSDKPLTGIPRFLPVTLLLGVWGFHLIFFCLNSFLYLLLSTWDVCLYAHENSAAYACLHAWVWKPEVIFRGGVFCVNLMLNWLARLIGQWAEGICLSLLISPTRLTDSRDPSQPFFFCNVGSWNLNSGHSTYASDELSIELPSPNFYTVSYPKLLYTFPLMKSEANLFLNVSEPIRCTVSFWMPSI